MVITRHYTVWGRVQGVYFRASTQSRAIELSIVGWVRNTDEGAVELIAQAEEAVLAELETWLWRGPDYAKVTRVDREPATFDANLKEFSLCY
ncbi:MAG: acylphosphatase [Flavobacteriales bacterium]|jgi:acylphosphatase